MKTQNNPDVTELRETPNGGSQQRMVRTQQLKAMLADERCGLDAIKEAGWVIESNGYSTFFRHESGQVEPIPWWATQMRDRAAEFAGKHARQQMREALGIES